MVAAPFILNLVMGISKWLGASEMTTPGKRFLLALFAIMGVVISNALLGDAIQLDSITNLTQIALESAAAFIAAHGSYMLFWSRK